MGIVDGPRVGFEFALKEVTNGGWQHGKYALPIKELVETFITSLNVGYQ